MFTSAAVGWISFDVFRARESKRSGGGGGRR